MELIRYYTFRVPCLSKIDSRKELSNLSGLEMELYKNPNFIYRYDPSGVTIVRGLFKPYRGDREFAEVLKRRSIGAEELDPFTLSTALESEILLTKPPKNVEKKVIHNEINLPFEATNFYAVLEVTSKCNLRCKHCYFYEDRNKLEEPETEELIERVRKLKKWGVCYVEVTGGEPTLREDLPSILSEVVRNDMFFYLPTNGVNITNIPTNLLRKADLITISIDGDEEFHDRFRGVRGSYKRAVNALKFLQDHGIKPTISVTITDDNLEYMEHLIKLGNKYNSDVMFSRVIRTGGALLNNLLFSREDKVEKDGVKTLGTIRVIQKMLKISKRMPMPAYLYGCDYGRKTFGISPDGRMLYCIYNRNLDVGHFDDYNHPTDFLNTVHDLIQEKKKKIKQCKECEIDSCGGLCDLSNIFKRLSAS